jgi:hypothetical protein
VQQKQVQDATLAALRIESELGRDAARGHVMVGPSHEMGHSVEAVPEAMVGHDRCPFQRIKTIIFYSIHSLLKIIL